MQLIRDAAELASLLKGSGLPQACNCALGSCGAWTSITEERWPKNQMTQLATLRNPDIDEPSFEEHHPNGTRYQSDTAPVAIKFFPYNRCDLWRCNECARLVLRYTEYGGYYVDHRVRELNDRVEVIG